MIENKRGSIALYDAQNLDDCPWPQTKEGQYAQNLLTPLIKKGVQAYIENIQTELCILVWDHLVLPLTINESEYDNSYVCSPHGYYISYARESLDLITAGWAHRSINALLWGADKVLRRFQINKVVIVNNWFYSTNLFPVVDSNKLIIIAQYLQKQFPDYAIIFRSVDPNTNPICFHTLHKIGFSYIANRQIFFTDTPQSPFFESRLFKSDLKLLENCDYEIIDSEQLAENDIPRLRELYRDIFIHKYSDLNPQFNEAFLSLALTKGLLHFKALKKNGQIDGVVGYHERNGMMFCPFFGYDRTVPKEVALYRLLSTILMLEAKQKNLLFHQSSGASMFKKIRKAQSCIEYLAVYHQHLRMKRKIPWIILKKMCNSFGITYMELY